MSSPPDDPERSILEWDTANRFEREIDLQDQAIEAVDNKAEHVTRLVGIVLGVVLTALSLGIRFEGGPPDVSLPVELSFGLGLLGMFGSITFAIITYLSSKLKMGLHPATAETINHQDLDPEEYAELLMNAYAFALEWNKEVIDTNYRRFRRTLTALFIGLSYLGLSAFIYVLVPGGSWGWATFVIGTVFVGGVTIYILSRKYLTHGPEGD